MPLPKITLLAEHCWIIRSERPGHVPRYYEAMNIWNGSPAHATIYHSELAAHNDRCNYVKFVGRAKGEVIDVVPLYGALIAPKV